MQKILVSLIEKDRSCRTICTLQNRRLDISKALSIARMHKLLRLFCHRLLVDRDYAECFDKEIYANCARVLLLHERERKEYLDTLNRLTSEFDKAGIRCVLLKGISLVFNDLPRDINDLDLLVDESRLLDVDRIMTKLGYDYVGDDRKPFLKKEDRGGNLSALAKWSNQFEYRKPGDNLLIEIHSGFFERQRTYSFDMEPMWSTVSDVLDRAVYRRDFACYELAAEDSIWLMAMHFAFRSSPSTGQMVFRYISDIANCVRNRDVNWDAVVQQAQRSSTNGFLCFSLEMVEFFYPGTVPASMIHELDQSLTKGRHLLKTVQHSCYRNFYTSSFFYMLCYRVLLPFAYNGRWPERVKSLLILPRVFKHPSRLHRIYGCRPSARFIWALYLLEPFRLVFRIIRKTCRVVLRVVCP